MPLPPYIPPDEPFIRKVAEVARRIGNCSPAVLMSILMKESALNPLAVNADSDAAGILQFIPPVAKELGTEKDKILAMTRIEQMDLVLKYFKMWERRGKPVRNDYDLYDIVFRPASWNDPVDATMYAEGSVAYAQNKHSDKNDDGKITRREMIEAGLKNLDRFTPLFDESGAPAAPDEHEIREQILRRVAFWEGATYKYGAKGANHQVDCSGFTKDIFRNVFGIELGDGTENQIQDGVPVEVEDLKAGDLVLWKYIKSNGQPNRHVGIYLGNDEVVHASGNRKRALPHFDKYSSYLSHKTNNARWGQRRVLGHVARSAAGSPSVYTATAAYESAPDRLDPNRWRREEPPGDAGAGENLSTLVTDGAEAEALAALPAPVPGELDIGDLRFGSVRFEEARPEHLNQVSALTQQMAGAVGVVDMLRADGSGVIGEGKVLPEVVATISLNATTRDDVNAALRPLVAMSRRCPFVAARSIDLARLMYGTGLTANNRSILRQAYPDADEETLDQLEETLSRTDGATWVPVTIRQVTVDAQPGAPDLYQVHVVLRLANVLPYVPRLSYWKTTEEAEKWAVYAARRAQNGAEFASLNEDGSAEGVGYDGREITAEPPDISRQTDNPQESYPFKKFYRGLLEEWQPGTGGLPIASTAGGPTEEAYPIAPENRGRLFERYDRKAPIGLSFLYLAGANAPDSRLARMVSSFERRIDFFKVMADSASYFSEVLPDNEFSLGEVSPVRYTFAGGYGVVGQLSRELGVEAEKIMRTVTADIRGDARLAEQIGEYYINDEGFLGEREAELELDPVWRAGIAEAHDPENGFTEFGVPSSTDNRVTVSLSRQLEHYQRSALTAFTVELTKLKEAHPNVYAAVLDEELTRLVPDASTDQPIAEGDDAWKAYNKAVSEVEAKRKELAPTYQLSYAFIQAVSKALPEDDTKRLREIAAAGSRLKQTVMDAARTEASTFSDSDIEGVDRYRGFLNLESTSVDSVRLAFAQRFGDRPWDGYAHPVTQHIGGAGAEVTLSFTTNDPLVLDQLGQIRHGQEQLGEIRKSQDIVPPLIDVYGPGNVLRAFGIRRLAYRSHQVTTNEPGYYQVRLDLVQDEGTLFEYERFGSHAFGAANAAVVLPLIELPGGSLLETIKQGSVATAIRADIRIEDKDDRVRLEADLVMNDGTTRRWPGRFDRVESLLSSAGVRAMEEATRRRLTVAITQWLGGGPTSIGVLPAAYNYALLNVQTRYEPRTNYIKYSYAPSMQFTDAYTRTWPDPEPAYLASLTGEAPADQALYFVGAARAAAQLGGFLVSEAYEPYESWIKSIERGRLYNESLSDPEVAARIAQSQALLSGQTGPEETPAAPEQHFTGKAVFGTQTSPFATRSLRTMAEADPGTFYAPAESLSYDGVLRELQSARAEWDKRADEFPTAYPDLLMPEVRDEVQRINLIGYDFPFGPGYRSWHHEDPFRNYQFAEDLRAMTAVQMAAVGLDALGELDAAEVPAFKEAYEAVLGRVREAARSGGQDAFPFSTDEAYFKQAAEHINTVTGTGRTKPLLRKDWVKLLRISATVRFVSALQEQAKKSAENAAGDDGEWRAAIGRTFDALVDEDAPFGVGLDVAGVSELLSATVNVSSDKWLSRMRRQLIDLYAADAQTIAGMLGYSDVSDEARRARLRRQLRSRWQGWQGMSRAFPSYQVYILGPQGSVVRRALADAFSWTAAMSIEIRKQAESAGQSAVLVMSNLRQQARMDGGGRSVTFFDRGDNDIAVGLKPGTHVAIHLGYGADASGMTRFTGRVVGIEPGPVTTVEVASYGTTLTNPTGAGNGFFVDGADGQATINQAVLYTLATTRGLDGLGRRDFGGSDELGRGGRERGDGDDYKTALAVRVSRGLQAAGVGKLFGFDPEIDGAFDNLAAAVGKHQLGKLEDLALGSSRLYENVWLTGGDGARYGFSNLAFGSLPNLITNGKGYGWAALPGESCWAQLNDQALLWPDYIVTTRPYNAHTPLYEMGEHPPRETVYFGPRHGHYIATSRPDYHAAASAFLSRAEMRRVLSETIDRSKNDGAATSATTSASPLVAAAGELVLADETRTDASLEALYQKVFWPYFEEQLYRVLKDGARSLAQSADESVRAAQAAVSQMLGGSIERFSLIARSDFGKDQVEEMEQALAPFKALRSVLDPWWDRLARPFNHLIWDAARMAMLSEPKSKDNPAESMHALYDIEKANAGHRQALLDAFLSDLFDVATDQTLLDNMSTSAPDHPIVSAIRHELEAVGFGRSKRVQPVVEHHFGSMYTTVCNSDIRTGTDDPDFANRITLRWPRKPDERLSFYGGEPGSEYAYSVQANPLIGEDFIQEQVIDYLNLDYAWADEAGNMVDNLDGDEFTNLAKALSVLGDKVRKNPQSTVAAGAITPPEGYEAPWQALFDRDEPVTVADAYTAANEITARYLQEKAGLNLKPKFSTVATNILLNRFRRMYTGTVVMAGDGRIEPHHVLHLYDDVKQMHGPVEVDGVYHSFTAQGFYSMLQPRLSASVRGVDPMLDTEFLGWSARYYGAMSWLYRLGAGAEGAIDWAARGLLWTGVAAIARRGFGYLIPGGGWALAATDAAVNIGGALYKTGRAKAHRYVGMVAEAIDVNPIVFSPLTYKGAPYVAGLTGATGPGTIREVVTNTLDDERAQGRFIGEKTWQVVKAELGSVGPQ